MIDSIKKQLLSLECEEDVRIIYACESGSRAWGFPSKDSDYDVRFLYVHPPDWYFSVDLEDKNDVIEKPIDGLIDMSGWDLRKALRLLYKSNPPLLEWLNSPIAYIEKHAAANRLRCLLPEYYSPTACLYHYLHMARGNYKEYLRGETVWIKKYFYVLRPLLAIRWIEEGRGIVPMEFETLLAGVDGEQDFKLAVSGLLERKLKGEELDKGPRIPEISDFIDREMGRLGDKQFERRGPKPPVDGLNEIFRLCVREAYRAG